jgi:hypothetical protein
MKHYRREMIFVQQKNWQLWTTLSLILSLYSHSLSLSSFHFIIFVAKEHESCPKKDNFLDVQITPLIIEWCKYALDFLRLKYLPEKISSHFLCMVVGCQLVFASGCDLLWLIRRGNVMMVENVSIWLIMSCFKTATQMEFLQN